MYWVLESPLAFHHLPTSQGWFLTAYSPPPQLSPSLLKRVGGGGLSTLNARSGLSSELQGRVLGTRDGCIRLTSIPCAQGGGGFALKSKLKKIKKKTKL